MTPRLGLRSRILALTMPVVILVSAAIAGILYTSLGQVFDVSAREIAVAEVLELRSDIGLHSVDELAETTTDDVSTRLSQVVDLTGRVRVTTDSSARTPVVAIDVPAGEIRSTVVDSLPGLGTGRYAVAAANAKSVDGRHYIAIVAVPTRVETTALGRSLEFTLIGAVGLIALLAAITTFTVGQALRPVDRMRHQVEDFVLTSRPAEPLEVPAGRDELSRLAETLNTVLDRLRANDAARRAFVADAGHELRSPLATLRLLLDRLGDGRSEEQRAVIGERATAEVDRLAVLVEDLLALAAADERATPRASEDVDLDDVVLGEAGALRARGMPIEVDVSPVRVTGDHHRLGRVVRNLLENAERHRHRYVRVILELDRDLALLIVDNDGPPVPFEDRERIFGRFVRLDDSRARDTGGTGLGLAIVAEIVRTHGGEVIATESPEGYCRFAVSLPAQPPPG